MIIAVDKTNKDSLIEDLYILPEKQKMGFGTKLLQFAVEQCADVPTLRILENNTDAKRRDCVRHCSKHTRFVCD